MQEPTTFCAGQEWSKPRMLHCFDLYSRSEKLAKTWRKHGWHAVAFDIANSKTQDILSREGFFEALDRTLSFLR